MVKSLSYRIIFYLMVLVPNICVSAENHSWQAIASLRSNQSDSGVSNATLAVFYQKEGENPSVVLELDSDQPQIKIENVGKKIVEQLQKDLQSAKKRECVFLVASREKKERYFCVKSMKCFYGPEKYHNLATCELSTNGAVMKMNYRDGDIQEVLLYKPENIKSIVDALNTGKGCIINLQQPLLSSNRQIKVEDYTNSSYIWWNGWTPGGPQLSGWVGMPHYEVGQQTEYNEVDINLDEDQKFEATYKKNQLIGWLTRCTLLGSSCILLCYLFKDRIFDVLREEFSWMILLVGKTTRQS